MDDVWPNMAVEESNLTVHISALLLSLAAERYKLHSNSAVN
jgi:DNA-binding winged helix-turn-helix (wHTH) protein